jgi:hypothetical protein
MEIFFLLIQHVINEKGQRKTNKHKHFTTQVAYIRSVNQLELSIHTPAHLVS